MSVSCKVDHIGPKVYEILRDREENIILWPLLIFFCMKLKMLITTDLFEFLFLYLLQPLDASGESASLDINQLKLLQRLNLDF